MNQTERMGASRRQGPTRSNGDRTRTKIMDAAEHLFGARGFDGVSLRDITEAAAVTLALASYHFGTKENLFEEVVARRAHILCAEREARLSRLSNPSVREILDAFLAPLFEFAASGDPGWRPYLKVLARLGEDPQWLDILSRHFDKTAQIYIAALGASMPRADARDVARGFTMMLHMMLTTVSQHARVDRLTSGEVRAGDLSDAYRVLLEFVSAGLASFQG
jgi:AcrR family transcriptional regulator